jgi:hypothetical protein
MVLSINDQIVADSRDRVPTTHNVLTSQRCESFGMLSAICAYHQISKYIRAKWRGNVKIQQLTIYSDH